MPRPVRPLMQVDPDKMRGGQLLGHCIVTACCDLHWLLAPAKFHCSVRVQHFSAEHMDRRRPFDTHRMESLRGRVCRRTTSSSRTAPLRRKACSGNRQAPFRSATTQQSAALPPRDHWGCHCAMLLVKICLSAPQATLDRPGSAPSVQMGSRSCRLQGQEAPAGDSRKACPRCREVKRVSEFHRK